MYSPVWAPSNEMLRIIYYMLKTNEAFRGINRRLT